METFAMVFDNDHGRLITGMLLQLMFEIMSLVLECNYIYDYIQLKLQTGIIYVRCTEYWEVRVFLHYDHFNVGLIYGANFYIEICIKICNMGIDSRNLRK